MRPAEQLGAGEQKLQAGEVAVGQGQIFGALGVEDGGNVAAVCFEGGHVAGGDFDDGAGVADGELGGEVSAETMMLEVSKVVKPCAATLME